MWYSRRAFYIYGAILISIIGYLVDPVYQAIMVFAVISFCVLYIKDWKKHAAKRVWRAVLGGEKTPLAGSVIQDVKPISGDMQLYVNLPRGKYTTKDVENAVSNIASAYRTHPQCIRVQRTKDESRPIVHILNYKTLNQLHPWPKTSIGKDGKAVIGVLGDGKPATVNLWSDIGTKVIWLVGARGSGKSRSLHVLLATAMRSGLVALDIIDAKGGVDLSVWKKHAHFFGTTVEDARLAVARANRVHDARLAMLAESDGEKEKFIVGKDGPLWLLVLEEAPEVLSDKTVAEGVGRLARLARASGVGIILISQIAKMEAIGGRGVSANIDYRVIFECDKQTMTQAIDNKITISDTQMPVGVPGTSLFLGESEHSGEIGRWFNIDPKTATSEAVMAELDFITLQAIND